jgi:hypothetical protein
MPRCLGEDLLVIQKEFAGYSDTHERLDLLAIDKQGSLVLIENKLGDTGRDLNLASPKIRLLLLRPLERKRALYLSAVGDTMRDRDRGARRSRRQCCRPLPWPDGCGCRIWRTSDWIGLTGRPGFLSRERAGESAARALYPRQDVLVPLHRGFDGLLVVGAQGR